MYIDVSNGLHHEDAGTLSLESSPPGYVRGEHILIVSVSRDFPWVLIVMPYNFSVWASSCSDTDNLNLM